MFSIFNCLRHYGMGSFEYLQIDESANHSLRAADALGISNHSHTEIQI